MTMIVICQKLLFFFVFFTPFLLQFPQPPSLFLSPPPTPAGRKKLQRQLVTLVTPAPSPEQLNNIVLKLSLLLPASLNLIHSGPRSTPPPPTSLPTSPVTSNKSTQHGISPGGLCVGGGDSKAETASLEQHCRSCVNAREQWVRWGWGGSVVWHGCLTR